MTIFGGSIVRDRHVERRRLYSRLSLTSCRAMKFRISGREATRSRRSVSDIYLCESPVSSRKLNERRVPFHRHSSREFILLANIFSLPLLCLFRPSKNLFNDDTRFIVGPLISGSNRNRSNRARSAIVL